MAGATGAFFFSISVVMDIGAGVLGILADLAQRKAKHITYLYVLDYCKAPSHEAFKFGLAAALVLLVAQVIANLLGGCVCVCSKDDLARTPTNKQIMAAACLFLSCVTVVVAFLMLIIGASTNSRSEETCISSLSHHHFLLVGGVLCFIHGLFSVAYYVSAKSATATKTTMGEEEKGRHKAHTGRTQMAEIGRHGTHSAP